MKLNSLNDSLPIKSIQKRNRNNDLTSIYLAVCTFFSAILELASEINNNKFSDLAVAADMLKYYKQTKEVNKSPENGKRYNIISNFFNISVVRTIVLNSNKLDSRDITRTPHLYVFSLIRRFSVFFDGNYAENTQRK
jgi:hypothetical protein